MNQFTKSTVLFLLLGLLIVNLWSFNSLINDKYKRKVFGCEVYRALEKSNSVSNAKKVLIGDSVALQMFDSNKENDTINSLATNQAISLAGQFIILNNYIKAGNKIQTAYLVFIPFSFINNLDQIYTYNYFVKPFYKEEYLKLLSKKVDSQVNKIPFVEFARIPFVLTTNWSPEYISEDKADFHFLSPISVEYLHKISDLAQKNKFKIVLISPPVSTKKKKLVHDINRKEITINKLDNLFKGYLENIEYLDESNFIDGTHLKEPDKYKSILIKKMI